MGLPIRPLIGGLAVAAMLALMWPAPSPASSTATVQGIVTYADGSPAHGANVLSCDEAHDCIHAAADATGHYALELPVGTLQRLEVAPPDDAGYRQVAEFVVTEDGASYDAQLGAGSITGLLTPDPGVPAEDYMVIACGPTEALADGYGGLYACELTVPDPDGTYRLLFVPDGTHEMQVVVPGIPQGRIVGYLSMTGSESQLDIVAPSAMIFGQIWEHDGTPSGHAFVNACAEHTCYAGQADADGQFEITHLVAGEYLLQTFSADFERSGSVGGVVVAEGEAVQQDIVLAGPEPTPTPTPLPTPTPTPPTPTPTPTPTPALSPTPPPTSEGPGVPSSLAGTLLFYSNSLSWSPPPPRSINEGVMEIVSYDCGPSGGWFLSDSEGNANGSYPGTFLTQVYADFGGGLVWLVIDFRIWDDEGLQVADGRMQYEHSNPQGDPPTLGCHVIEDEEDGDTFVFTGEGRFQYTATITAGGTTTTDSGYADWSFNCAVPDTTTCDVAGTTGLRFLGQTLPRNASGEGSASTADNATAEQPIATKVEGPESMAISIREDVAWPWLAPDYTLLGQAVHIDVDLEGWEPSAEDPIVLTFRIHQSLLEAANLQPAEVTVLRDGEPAPDCTGTPGHADPDPCVASREMVGDELVLVVLSSDASVWLLAATPQTVDHSFDGFFEPVSNPGQEQVRNVVKAGQTVPLRWRLTDADGAPVLAIDSAKVSATGFDCGRGGPADLLSETSSGQSGLRSLGGGYFLFNWSTPRSYADSCKELTLTLEVDGQSVSATALFEFRR